MHIDDHFTFAMAENVFAAAGTNLAGVGKTMGGSEFRAGNNDQLKLMLSVHTAFVGAGNISFKLVSDAQVAIAEDGSATEHAVLGPFTAAELPAGKKMYVTLPVGSTYEEFLGLLVVGTATTTAGAINAFLALDAQDWEAFPDAVN